MKQLLWVLLIAAVFFGIVWDRYPLQDAQDRLDAFPLQGAGFRGQELPLTEFEAAFLENVNVMKRYYAVGDQQVFLTAIDGTHNRSAVHDPTYCYVGSGWHVVDRERVIFAGGEADKIIIARPGQQREVLLWFSDGKERFASVFQYWIRATLRRISFGASGQEPVRVIMQPVGGEQPDWKKLMRDFVPLQDL